MNILFLSAEVAPFVTVGGLSQVMYFLPRSLRSLGNDARLFTAAYGTMDKTFPAKKKWKLKKDISNLEISSDHMGRTARNFLCDVSYFKSEKTNTFAYFLENNEYYKLRANVFGYNDDHMRFALLSKGCLEWLLYKYNLQKSKSKTEKGTKENWFPDIIHCNDWHTGYFIELARTCERYHEMLANTPIVLTVHNFSYQGNYDFRYCLPQDRDTGKEPLASLLSDKLQKQNPLLRGLLYADAINTVSPTHAVEVLTPEYSEGLDNTLYEVRSKLVGILNGLDTREFNPETDLIIKTQFNAKVFVKGRNENKMNIQREFFLPIGDNIPLIAISGRMAQQKGWDILLDVLPHLLSEKADLQLIVLGAGDERYRKHLMLLQQTFPKQIGLHLRSDFRLPRMLFAGADMMLIPSIFEPGGIVALEALRYGAVPIVRRTGGLNDIVTDFDPQTKKGNGFSFVNKDPWALYAAIIEALTIYKSKKLWQQLVSNCLKCDFSWQHSAKEYQNWYSRVIGERRRATSATPHPAYGSSALLETNISS